MIDLRNELPRENWTMPKRVGNPTSITLHYNGPPVSNRTKDGELNQLKMDAGYHIKTMGADGLQYHYAVGSDGSVYYCRDVSLTLWHCANKTGNDHSIAVHIPVGGSQDATEAQWNAAVDLFDSLIHEYGMSGKDVVIAHREWKRSDGKPQSQCPGALLYNRLLAWRTADSVYEVIHGIDFAAVREGPGTKYQIAGKFYPGQQVRVDVIKTGQVVSNDRRWAHLSKNNPFRDLGFIHMSLLRKV